MNEQWEVIEISEMQVVGVNTTTSNEVEATEQGRIVPLHREFIEQNLSDLIQSDDKRIFAVYDQYSDLEHGEYRYFIGHCAETIPEGLSAVVIPKGRYLRFSSERGILSDILPEAWKNIWRLTSDPNFEYSRSFELDFEFHNYESSDSLDAQVEIYLSID
ncbi:GyrI-like domain-containing protein [Candidatus Comchoanobacter bicostacola]|uniref:GyrI-like domain-containing protein n=1 Tax=Candidatus Comchoanobacter bicostacola TaxID=2919598 RepID=A0ABY5DLG3_9GAMM|nr:GyrI-like domain-containing protein [Candidatus Comchoanobacter bicostacola]UTC24803.1 GyrI-like domain-containing protein [Candidatus Comchoanobacter bicostacola]